MRFYTSRPTPPSGGEPRAVAPRRVLVAWLGAVALLVTPAASRVLIGYYPTYARGSLPVDNIPYGKLTHVCHAFLTANSSGKLTNAGSLAEAKLVEAAHRRGVRALVSLGGADGAKTFGALATDPVKRKRYVAAVARFVREQRYDGVDLDWEFPHDAATADALVSLLAELRAALDRPGHRAIVIAGLPASRHSGRWFHVEKAGESVDFWNVMAYDLAGPWGDVAAHHSPLSADPRDPAKSWRSVARAMRYWSDKRGVPKDRLVLGLPCYGRGFPVKTPYARFDRRAANRHKALTYRQILALQRRGWTLDRSAQGTPWLSSPDRTAVIGFDDTRSIAAKAAWAKRHGFGGLFLWSIQQDRLADGSHPLLEAAADAWPADAKE